MPAKRLPRPFLRATTALGLLLCLLLSPIAVAETVEYTLKKGDTLWQLSKDFLGSSQRYQQLQQDNRVQRPKRLHPGAVLQFPRSLLTADDAPVIATFIEGDVSLLRGKQATLALRPGDQLMADDHIITAPGGQAELHFFDGSRLQLRENSNLSIQRSDSFGRGRIRHIKVELLRGLGEYHIAPQRDANRRFEIITPAATTSVRGTDFRVRVSEEGRLQEEVLSGKTLVHNTLGQQAVAKGEGIAVAPGEPPSEVITLLPPPDLSQLPASIDGAHVALQWPALPGAVSYQIQLAGEPDFQQLWLDQQTATPQLRYRVTEVTTLHLRVSGIDEGGFVGLPAQHSLNVNWRPETAAIAGLAPQGVFPAGAEAQWPAVEKAGAYLLEIATEPTFAQPLQQLSAAQPQAIIGESLPPGDYVWRVQAQSADGQRGDFSEAAKLQISGPQPAAPNATAPRDLLVLRWPAMQAAVLYQIEVYAADNGDAPLTQLQTNHTLVAVPRPPQGSYRSRLRAIYPGDIVGPWSAAGEVVISREAYEYLLPRTE